MIEEGRKLMVFERAKKETVDCAKPFELGKEQRQSVNFD